jgi:hypothetical protein
MSLSARDRHALHGIEKRLTRSDAELASLHGMFARLTSGEEMPIRERICAGWRHTLCRQPRNRRDALRDMARRPIRHMGWQRAMLLLWLLTALAMTAAALALSRVGGSRTCAPPWTACASSSSAGRLRPAMPKGAAGQSQRRATMSPGTSRGRPH